MNLAASELQPARQLKDACPHALCTPEPLVSHDALLGSKAELDRQISLAARIVALATLQATAALVPLS
eukprot:CAMPEP_0203917496 /NCGR_PEP_ID=MMETSP0359-20131031/58111_1 /ASSEMBLY_ACC=CAM_ASM_000338 /TAXON_ID=268821 /ORGANISM="Scrippsiella Hangoei, Strain SHTV-5" /LENGTH=67 /DNA_ID=CAMNT_0050844413 /DNA_START=47 /DNA_END=247 /DNA_ORIENTATION=+